MPKALEFPLQDEVIVYHGKKPLPIGIFLLEPPETPWEVALVLCDGHGAHILRRFPRLRWDARQSDILVEMAERMDTFAPHWRTRYEDHAPRLVE